MHPCEIYWLHLQLPSTLSMLSEPMLETLTPPVQNFWHQKTGMQPLSFEAICGGGEFGVVRSLYPVPAKRQGKAITFDVTGKASYPNGRGQILRSRQGLRVRPRESALSTTFRALVLFAGVISYRSAARWTCLLPRAVADDLAVTPSPEAEILWSFHVGFPVDDRQPSRSPTTLQQNTNSIC